MLGVNLFWQLATHIQTAEFMIIVVIVLWLIKFSLSVWADLPEINLID